MNLLTKFFSLLFADQKISGRMLEPSSPEIISCNKFLVHFCDSDIAQIEISESEINTSGIELFRDLSDIPSERIRNRFRILSNLDPIKNTEEEIGRLKLSYSRKGKMTDMDLFTTFPIDTSRFTIRK
jgi:hypothetical protein